MGKKTSVNEKAVEAKDRKAASKAEASSKASKQAEDAAWKEAGDGAKSKAQAKREADDKKKQEAAAKKLEAKKLLEAEEAALAKKASAKAKTPTGKVTQFQLQQQKAAEAKQREAASAEAELAKKREVAEQHYAAIVEADNTNRMTDVVSASGVDEALSALVIPDDAAGDKHPEKRMKAAWMAYQERMLPELRAEKPNLRMNQYKDMVWKLWQKAPENPLNQVPPQ